MRKILHIDMDAFFASVEQRDNPELRGKPVVVGGKPGGRGVVAACSYEARKFGIHSAMPSTRAHKLCPDTIFVPPRFDAYREASEKIRKIFREFTSLIEPLSLDEAYLDVTEIAARSDSATEVARAIKQEIKSELNLTASAGVSYNKFLAKVASDMDKPDGLTVIRPERAIALLERLEIRKFFGIGKVTEKKMQALGIFTGEDLKKLELVELQTQFGKAGQYYFNVVRGIDERPVSSSRSRKSIGKETTFADNLTDKTKIWSILIELTERVVNNLREKDLGARTVTIKARYADFRLITRSVSNTDAMHTQEEIVALIPALLKKTEIGKRPIRLIGISLSGLSEANDNNKQHDEDAEIQRQMGLFH